MKLYENWFAPRAISEYWYLIRTDIREIFILSALMDFLFNTLFYVDYYGAIFFRITKLWGDTAASPVNLPTFMDSRHRHADIVELTSFALSPQLNSALFVERNFVFFYGTHNFRGDVIPEDFDFADFWYDNNDNDDYFLDDDSERPGHYIVKTHTWYDDYIKEKHPYVSAKYKLWDPCGPVSPEVKEMSLGIAQQALKARLLVLDSELKDPIMFQYLSGYYNEALLRCQRKEEQQRLHSQELYEEALRRQDQRSLDAIQMSNNKLKSDIVIAVVGFL